MTFTKSFSLVVLFLVSSLISFFPVLAARGFVTVRFPVAGVLVTVLVALLVFFVGFGLFLLLVPRSVSSVCRNKVSERIFL